MNEDPLAPDRGIAWGCLIEATVLVVALAAIYVVGHALGGLG